MRCAGVARSSARGWLCKCGGRAQYHVFGSDVLPGSAVEPAAGGARKRHDLMMSQQKRIDDCRTDRPGAAKHQHLQCSHPAKIRVRHGSGG